MRPRCFPKPFLLLAKEGKDSQTGQTRGERAFYGRKGRPEGGQTRPQGSPQN